MRRGYKLGDATKFGLVFENEDQGSATLDRDNWYLSASHEMNSWTLAAGIGQLGESTNGAKDGGDFFAIGASKDMSDMTELYVQYVQMANDTNGTNGLEYISSGFADKSTSALVVGINVNFSSAK